MWESGKLWLINGDIMRKAYDAICPLIKNKTRNMTVCIICLLLKMNNLTFSEILPFCLHLNEKIDTSLAFHETLSMEADFPKMSNYSVSVCFFTFVLLAHHLLCCHWLKLVWFLLYCKPADNTDFSASGKACTGVHWLVSTRQAITHRQHLLQF